MKIISEWNTELQRQIDRPATIAEQLEMEAIVIGMFEGQKVAYLADIRAMRAQVLARLNGYGAMLFLSEPPDQTAEKELCRTIIQGLLDITTMPAVEGAETFSELKAIVKAEYARLVGMASPEMVKAFRSLDA